MRTILVATDFSKTSKNAAYYAAEMAIYLHADLFILYVYEIPVAYLSVPPAFSEAEVMKKLEQYMNELKEEIGKKTNNVIRINTEISIGQFHTELESECKKINPYVVVIGSQATSATERLIFGEHALFAMKNLEWPIIGIPPHVTFSGIRKIGLVCNLHHIPEEKLLEEIETFADDFDAEIHILNIRPPGTYRTDIAVEAAELKRKTGYMKPYFHFTVGADTDGEIIDFSKNNNIDLLIVLPGRHNLPEKIFHKSHTKQLVLHSDVPVMALQLS